MGAAITEGHDGPNLEQKGVSTSSQSRTGSSGKLLEQGQPEMGESESEAAAGRYVREAQEQSVLAQPWLGQSSGQKQRDLGFQIHLTDTSYRYLTDTSSHLPTSPERES